MIEDDTYTSRRNMVGVYLNGVELKMFTEYCKKNKLTKSAGIRQIMGIRFEHLVGYALGQEQKDWDEVFNREDVSHKVDIIDHGINDLEEVKGK